MKNKDSFVHNLRLDFHMTQRTLAPVRFSDGLTGRCENQAAKTKLRKPSCENQAAKTKLRKPSHNRQNTSNSAAGSTSQFDTAQGRFLGALEDFDEKFYR